MKPRNPRHARSGTLVIIGGHEDREGPMPILREVAKLVGGRKLCVTTIATRVGTELWEIYEKAFRELGIRNLSHLGFERRHDANSEAALNALQGAHAVFFTGGDQLRITSDIGGTLIEKRIHEIYAAGGVIAGTSAGASVMSNTMLVAGNEGSFRIGGGLRMAPGLGFLNGVIIDQHFTERGRFGRLLGAIAHNPQYLGIGLDENTGIVVKSQRYCRVIGRGCIYVADARDSADSNISDSDRDTALSLFNVRTHLLSEGDKFDLCTREPTPCSPDRRIAPVKKRRKIPLRDKAPRRATDARAASSRA